MVKPIRKKLQLVQAELKCKKSQYNSFGKYYYRTLDDILESAKPLLAKHGLVLNITDKPILIGDWHYVEATATLADTESEGVITVSASAREELQKGMSSGQCTGAASSYARKYCLNGLFCIDDTQDLDTAAYQQAQNKPTSRQLGELEALAKQAGVDIKKIVSGYKLKSLTDMSLPTYERTINELNRRIRGTH